MSIMNISPAMSSALTARCSSLCSFRPANALHCGSIPSHVVVRCANAAIIQETSFYFTSVAQFSSKASKLLPGRYRRRKTAALIVTTSASAENGTPSQANEASSLPSRPPSRVKRSVVEAAKKRSKSSARGRKMGGESASSSNEEAAIDNSSDNGAIAAASDSQSTQRSPSRLPSRFRHRSPIPAMLARNDGGTLRTYWRRGEKATGFYKAIPRGAAAGSGGAPGRGAGSASPFQLLRPPSRFHRRSPLQAGRQAEARRAAAGKEAWEAAARFQALVNRSLEERTRRLPARPPSAFKLRNRVRAMGGGGKGRAASGRLVASAAAAAAAAPREAEATSVTHPPLAAAAAGVITSPSPPTPSSSPDSSVDPLLDRLLALPSPPGVSDLSGLSGKQLQGVLKGRGVAGMWKMRKAELVEVALKELQVDWQESRHRRGGGA